PVSWLRECTISRIMNANAYRSGERDSCADCNGSRPGPPGRDPRGERVQGHPSTRHFLRALEHAADTEKRKRSATQVPNQLVCLVPGSPRCHAVDPNGRHRVLPRSLESESG